MFSPPWAQVLSLDRKIRTCKLCGVAKKKKKGKRKSDEGAVASDSIIGPWTLGFGHSPWVGGDNLVLYF